MKQIRAATKLGDRILDPFAGSGTTLLAAEAEGREAVGIEQNASYCEIIRKRLEKSAVDLGLFATDSARSLPPGRAT